MQLTPNTETYTHTYIKTNIHPGTGTKGHWMNKWNVFSVIKGCNFCFLFYDDDDDNSDGNGDKGNKTIRRMTSLET